MRGGGFVDSLQLSINTIVKLSDHFCCARRNNYFACLFPTCRAVPPPIVAEFDTTGMFRSVSRGPRFPKITFRFLCPLPPPPVLVNCTGPFEELVNLLILPDETGRIQSHQE